MSDYPQWPEGPQDQPPPGWQPPPGASPPPFGQQPPPGTPPPGYGGYQQYGYGYGYGTGVQLAGFWIRFLASFLDGLIISIPLAIIAVSVGTSSSGNALLPFDPSGGLGVNVLGVVVSMLYYGLLIGGPTGQTLGKKVCNIRVVDVDTQQPGIGPGRGIGRYFASWLSQIVLYLGYLWMLWDPKKQCWHDKLARTLVVKT